MCLTETWLQDSVFNAELFSSDYDIFRYDRNLVLTDRTTGGGVLVAFRGELREFFSSSINSCVRKQ